MADHSYAESIRVSPPQI